MGIGYVFISSTHGGGIFRLSTALGTDVLLGRSSYYFTFRCDSCSGRNSFTLD